MNTTTFARWLKRGAAAIAALLVLAFAVGSIGHRTASPRSAGAGFVSNHDAQLESKAVVRGLARPASGGGSTTTYDVAQSAPAPSADAGGLPGLPDRIVRNADLSVKVRKGSFDSSWANAVRAATRLGGYIVSSNRGVAPVPVLGADSRREPAAGDLTIRVPASRFEEALIALRALGSVTGDQVTSEDATQEFVDLQSRLKNQKAQQAVLIRLMAQAKTIQETLAVQEQLSQVQDQVEQITGRINVLRTLTEFSAITLHLFEPGALGAPVPPQEGPSFSQAWDTAVEGLVRIGTVGLIGTTWLAPFAFLGLALAWIRRFRARPAEPAA